MKQIKRVVANTVINEVKSNIKKAELKKVELQNAIIDNDIYLDDQKKLLAKYEVSNG